MKHSLLLFSLLIASSCFSQYVLPNSPLGVTLGNTGQLNQITNFQNNIVEVRNKTGYYNLTIENFDTGFFSSQFIINSNGSFTSKLTLNNDEKIGFYGFGGYDGTYFQQGGGLLGVIDGAVSPGDMPTRLEFSTTNDGTSVPTTKMTIKNNGNVGMGMANPSYKLDVFGLIAIDGHAIAGLDGVNDIIKIGDVDGAGATLALYDQTSTETLRVTNGKIGIGTTTPDEKLSVNGKIHTKEVRVDLTGWPDYVFSDNYNLPPLEMLENYIKENGHLQNIPSAEEVEKNGLLLGEMNAKLLEKIEELTLYTIQQQKELEAQKELNKSLEERLIKIEKFINKAIRD